MVRIRILWEQATMLLRSLRATGEIAAAAAILGASLGGLGGDGGESTDESVSVPAVPAAVAPAAAVKASRDATEPELAFEAAMPSNLLQLPASVDSALVFDLEANRMHLFSGAGESSSQIGDFFVAVGKNGIEKSREGDEKTPVGIYFIASYIPGEELPAIYGAGAYPITYPNAWDRRLGRTGSGIWIHGTDKDDDSLLPQSSRGCLTLLNADFLSMAQRVGIRTTPVIVTNAVSWSSKEALESDRAGLASAVEAWRRDWESLSTDAYLGHYSATFRTADMDFRAWAAYKRRVNARKSYIRVGVSDLGIYAYPGEPELFLVTFDQRYQSSNFQGRTWKHQYWRREDGDWRIVHESGG